jgi:hypothetical protein
MKTLHRRDAEDMINDTLPLSGGGEGSARERVMYFPPNTNPLPQGGERINML